MCIGSQKAAEPVISAHPPPGVILRADQRLPPQGKRRPEGSVLRLREMSRGFQCSIRHAFGDGLAFRYPLCRRSRFRTDPSRRGRPDQGRPLSPLWMTKIVDGTNENASVCLERRIPLTGIFRNHANDQTVFIGYHKTADCSRAGSRPPVL